MPSNRLAPLALAGLLGAFGCGKSSVLVPEAGAPPVASGPVTFAGGASDGGDVTVDGALCTRCHGDISRAPLATDAPGIALAPPVDVSGATSGAKVGAHLAHLRGSAGS